jgi:hypothetical protein
MSTTVSRRRFLTHSFAASAAAPAIMSLEERHLLARSSQAVDEEPPVPLSHRWYGQIGKVRISRLICGGNLISGYAHSRDLIYVSDLLRHYFTDDRVMDTWALCEQHGINTMIAFPGDAHCIDVYRRYRARGGKIQYLAQIKPELANLKEAVTSAVDAGAVGAFLVGNLGDEWIRDGAVGRIAEVVGHIKDAGLISGVAGHELRTTQQCEAGAVAPDFYVKTLHDQSYWSKQQPGQDKDVIDNYRIDNYWCQEPDKVIGFMAQTKRPWIAYKVLAAGAIPPKRGFHYAFTNGADFAAVGMFDFQVADDVSAANAVLNRIGTRDRPWMA